MFDANSFNYNLFAEILVDFYFELKANKNLNKTVYLKIIVLLKFKLILKTT